MNSLFLMENDIGTETDVKMLGVSSLSKNIQMPSQSHVVYTPL